MHQKQKHSHWDAFLQIIHLRSRYTAAGKNVCVTRFSRYKHLVHVSRGPLVFPEALLAQNPNQRHVFMKVYKAVTLVTTTKSLAVAYDHIAKHIKCKTKSYHKDARKSNTGCAQKQHISSMASRRAILHAATPARAQNKKFQIAVL